MKKILLTLGAVSMLLISSCKCDKGEQLEFLPENITAKGTLVIEGGGDRIAPILNKIIEKGGGPDSCKLLVIPFASQVLETGERQAAEFRALGCKNADYILCPKDSIAGRRNRHLPLRRRPEPSEGFPERNQVL